MMNGDRKEGICRLNVDGNGCDYLRILSDLETKLRNNTNPKEKIELALQGALILKQECSAATDRKAPSLKNPTAVQRSLSSVIQPTRSMTIPAPVSVRC